MLVRITSCEAAGIARLLPIDESFDSLPGSKAQTFRPNDLVQCQQFKLPKLIRQPEALFESLILVIDRFTYMRLDLGSGEI